MSFEGSCIWLLNLSRTDTYPSCPQFLGQSYSLFLLKHRDAESATLHVLGRRKPGIFGTSDNREWRVKSWDTSRRKAPSLEEKQPGILERALDLESRDGDPGVATYCSVILSMPLLLPGPLCLHLE